MLLKGFDPDIFLREYWQRRPLLIKNPERGFTDPIEADELAGLSCDSDMEARLITRTQTDSWQLFHGPFTADRFAGLGETNWTLLVQAVDQVHEGVEALKRYFGFLPAWRIDDVMVSYACDGGGVGPHFDQYDVFLIQGCGSRRWQLGQYCDADTRLRDDTELSLLETFNATTEYLLEPGDILYLPPRVAHHGVSIGESLCYSVGFRAPSHAQLLLDFSDTLAEALTEDQRFQDPSCQQQQETGQIQDRAIDQAFEAVTALMQNKSLFTDSFGRYVTLPKYPERIIPPDLEFSAAEIPALLNNQTDPVTLHVNPTSRLAYTLDQTRQVIKLFVDGQLIPCETATLSLVRALCGTPWTQPLAVDQLLPERPATACLLAQLLNQGSLLISDENDLQDGDVRE